MKNDFEARESATMGRPGSTVERRAVHIEHSRAHPNCQRWGDRISARTVWVDGQMIAVCLDCFKAIHGAL
jgi:hypothetical protein